ncbi:hypothetical protein [Pelagibaculum spongiae]|uniref:Lipoprotein n=1 Tax=Pelagibaculum spongiae TaxID=2080658 RepID=A0A2V1H4U4_9GAMM|nr:hypothetical protein [Pelagibaculum spongiae]PVZ72217.1 hypothetical protein DC094_04160 [Pelagibaculum spongiae]
MKKVLLSMMLLSLLVSCGNNQGVDASDTENLVSIDGSWMDSLEEVNSAHGLTAKPDDIPASMPDLVTLGSINADGDFELIYSEHVSDMTIIVLRKDGLRWTGSGYDSDNVDLLLRSDLVYSVGFTGYLGNGDYVFSQVITESRFSIGGFSVYTESYLGLTSFGIDSSDGDHLADVGYRLRTAKQNGGKFSVNGTPFFISNVSIGQYSLYTYATEDLGLDLYPATIDVAVPTRSPDYVCKDYMRLWISETTSQGQQLVQLRSSQAQANALRDRINALGEISSSPDQGATYLAVVASVVERGAGFFAVRLLPTGDSNPFVLDSAYGVYLDISCYQ